MKCAICKHGETSVGIATMTIVRFTTTLVVKNVPAEVCQTCGEEYFDEQVVAQLERLVDDISKSGVEVEIRDFSAAAA